MDNVSFDVQVMHRRQEPSHRPTSLYFGIRLHLYNAIKQVSPGNQFHDQVHGNAWLHVSIDQFDNVRMIERLENGRFLLPLQVEASIVPQTQNLDGS